MAGLLAAVSDYSPGEAGARVGLSGEQVRQYRKGEWKRLESLTKRKIRDFLGHMPLADPDGYAKGLLFAAAELDKKAAELRQMATRC